jgi:hypothetical protein
MPAAQIRLLVLREIGQLKDDDELHRLGWA